jgi:uncharacterized protein DUF6599
MASLRRLPSRDRKGAVLRLIVFSLAAGALNAAIWPEKLGDAARKSADAAAIQDRRLWEEYGLEEAEKADYEAFRGTAWRLHDATGAMAAFQWQRPADAKPSKLLPLSVTFEESTLLAFGNYLLRIDGKSFTAQELQPLLAALPRLEQSQLPALKDYLPLDNLVANSERYILGPVSLDRFEPRIPPSAAAFHTGAEAQFGVFRAGNQEMKLTIFSFPTPAIARERAAEMQKLGGAVVKRTGPLVAALVAPPDANEAEKLLSKVRYQATISWSERVPTRRDNIGDLIVNIFILIGFLLCFAVVSGLAIGGVRAFLRHGSPQSDAMITLHLQDR